MDNDSEIYYRLKLNQFLLNRYGLVGGRYIIKSLNELERKLHDRPIIKRKEPSRLKQGS